MLSPVAGRMQASTLLLLLVAIGPVHAVIGRDEHRISTFASGGVACSNSSFACKDGRCIPATWKCDGDFDCLGQEDEEGCHDSCGEDEFRCSSSSFAPLRARETNPRVTASCIPNKWRCDGEFDCDDRSDEANCQTVVCKDNQFTCSEMDGKFKLCIPQTWVCDGQSDCGSGADEANCTDTKPCDTNEFDCGNSVCIFKDWHCDGEDDCGNGKDEIGCNATVHECDPAKMFKCATGGNCIPEGWKCDGEADCHDRSDELSCGKTTTTCTLASEFACATGHMCINKLWVCDGERDCPDASDEVGCQQPKECPQGTRKCSSGQCLASTLWCDGHEDCPAGDDEHDDNCTVPATKVCEEGRDFLCPSAPAQCVPYAKLCTDNSRYNCGDDATCSADIILCEKGSNACTCRPAVGNRTVCHCHDGYTPKNLRCIDVNECETPGRCDQECKNLPGSYKCSCHAHYLLEQKDGEAIPSRCRAAGGDPLVLLSNRASIRQFDMVTHAHLPLIRSPGSAVAMDFHMSNGTIIWSDITLRKIMMCTIGNASVSQHLAVKDKCDEKEQTVLVEGDVHTPDGLAVDWIHDLLFWTDGQLDTISVMDLKTRKRRVLFKDALEEPRAIAVDPEAGLIFWTDWGKEARIERAGMDGQHRRVILKGTNIKWPNGLALDLLDKRLYWADAKVKSIFSSDYYGGDIKVVLHSHSYLRHPFSLAIFEDRVFYTDWEHDGVISVNKFTGSDVKKLMSSVSTPMTVRIYHAATQPSHPNKCENHGCNDAMCLPRALIRTPMPVQEMMLHDGPYSCVCEGTELTDRLECMAEAVTSSHGFSLPTMLVFLAVAVAAVVGYAAVRRRRSGGSFTALHFDNPVYRRTTEPEMEFGLPVHGEMEEVPTSPAFLPFNDQGHDNNTMVEPMDRPLTANT